MVAEYLKKLAALDEPQLSALADINHPYWMIYIFSENSEFTFNL
jgi:hypothetical protein